MTSLAGLAIHTLLEKYILEPYDLGIATLMFQQLVTLRAAILVSFAIVSCWMAELSICDEAKAQPAAGPAVTVEFVRCIRSGKVLVALDLDSMQHHTVWEALCFGIWRQVVACVTERQRRCTSAAGAGLRPD